MNRIKRGYLVVSSDPFMRRVSKSLYALVLVGLIIVILSNQHTGAKERSKLLNQSGQQITQNKNQNNRIDSLFNENQKLNSNYSQLSGKLLVIEQQNSDLETQLTKMGIKLPASVLNPTTTTIPNSPVVTVPGKTNVVKVPGEGTTIVNNPPSMSQFPTTTVPKTTPTTNCLAKVAGIGLLCN